MDKDVLLTLSGGQLNSNNISYVEALYEDYINDPSSVSEYWREIFNKLEPVSASKITHSSVKASLREAAHQNTSETQHTQDFTNKLGIAILAIINMDNLLHNGLKMKYLTNNQYEYNPPDDFNFNSKDKLNKKQYKQRQINEKKKQQSKIQDLKQTLNSNINNIFKTIKKLETKTVKYPEKMIDKQKPGTSFKSKFNKTFNKKLPHNVIPKTKLHKNLTPKSQQLNGIGKIPSKKEIEESIQLLKENTPGITGIPTTYYKKQEKVPQWLYKFIRYTYLSNTIPDILKINTIIPIPKFHSTE